MLTLTEIADAFDTLSDIMVSDGMGELAGRDPSFWRDAALCLRLLASELLSYQEIGKGAPGGFALEEAMLLARPVGGIVA